MVEQEDEVTTAYPPAFCSRACRNALSDVCLSVCAVKRDGSWFDGKHVDIQDVAYLTAQEFADLEPKQRTIFIGIVMEALVANAQGRVYERPAHSHRGSRVFTTFPASALQDDRPQGDPTHQIDGEAPCDPEGSTGSLVADQERPS